MKKLFLITITLIKIASFASSGNGVGNGGLGYICETDNPNLPKITITLDMMEMLADFYDPNFFKDYRAVDREYLVINSYFHTYYKEVVRDYNGRRLPVKINYIDVRKAKYLSMLFKEAFIHEVDLELKLLEEIFTKKELQNLKKAKDQIIHNFDLYFSAGPRLFKNFTLDTGKIKEPTPEVLTRYGLKNCELVQVFVLNFMKPIHKTKETNYFLGSFVIFTNPARFLDKFSFKALLWHEVIYYGLNDIDSNRTRKLVRKILKELYL